MDDILKNRVRAWFARSVKANSSVDLPEVSGALATTVGEVRSENQDRAAIVRFSPESAAQRAFVLAVLCDGMGGMADGGKCAEVAVTAILARLINSTDADVSLRLRAAVNAANAELFAELRGRGGTTVVAVLFTASKTVGVSVGDSRLYARSKDGKLRQLSVDDTIAGELSRIRGDTARPDDLEPFSKQLAQFVGMGDNMEPRVYPLDKSEGDLHYLLSSDGAHSSPHSVLESIFSHSPSPHIGLGRLIHLSNWSGGADNATLICIGADLRSALQDAAKRSGLLEIWDSFGKIEIILSTPSAQPVSASAASPERPKAVAEPEHTEKRRRTKPKAAGPKADKPKPEDRGTAPRLQRTLEIEVGTTEIQGPVHEPAPAGPTHQPSGRSEEPQPAEPSPPPGEPQKP